MTIFRDGLFSHAVKPLLPQEAFLTPHFLFRFTFPPFSQFLVAVPCLDLSVSVSPLNPTAAAQPVSLLLRKTG